MKTYFITFLGNDGFETTHTVEASNFNEATAKAHEMLPKVQGLTIEAVEISAIEEL